MPNLARLAYATPRADTDRCIMNKLKTIAASRQDIVIRARAGAAHHGMLRFQTHYARCSLGAKGLTRNKKEGDKKTPLGRFALRRVWYRADRIALPQSALPIRQISPKSGWCDDASSPTYNRPIMCPNRSRHEKLWRIDRLYDVFFELGVNDDPIEPGAGSAIFLHLTKNNYQPTLGCVAVSPKTMDYLLCNVRNDTCISIV